MKFAAHAVSQCFVDQLVLLDPGFPLEIGGDDLGVIVIAIACQVVDDHIGAGQGIHDKSFDLVSRHRHRVVTIPMQPYDSSDM